MATKKDEVKVVEQNEPYKPKRFLELALENNKVFYTDFSAKFEIVNKEIEILLGLLNCQINHSDLSELEFFLGQISNNIGKIATVGLNLSYLYGTSEAEILRYIIDTKNDLLMMPNKTIKQRVDLELSKLIHLKSTLEDIERLLPKRAEYIRTLISCEKEKLRMDFNASSKQP
jgi:hypothetical protein